MGDIKNNFNKMLLITKIEKKSLKNYQRTSSS